MDIVSDAGTAALVAVPALWIAFVRFQREHFRSLNRITNALERIEGSLHDWKSGARYAETGSRCGTFGEGDGDGWGEVLPVQGDP